MDTLTRQTCLNAITDLHNAGSAAVRAEIVKRVAGQLGVSTDVVYRHLKALGWTSGRKERADKGTSRVSNDALRQAAQITAMGLNKRGEPNLPLKEAHRIAKERGLEAGQVSAGHLGRLLRREGLGLDQMRAASAAVVRVSQHPNHVAFFDISICAQWYFRDASGKKLEPYRSAAEVPYKPEQIRQISKTIHRYVWVDHCTGAYYVQYYYSGGERAEDIVDFFYRAMAAKRVGTDAYPLRGLPRRIVMDPGSANRSQMVRNLLDNLGIIAEYHAPGNAKASGAVEVRHNHWQRSFEGRLRSEPAVDLAELNARAEKFCAIANAERSHSRYGESPVRAWAKISPGQLRECPAQDVFLQLATTDRRIGTLNNYLWLQAEGRKWLIRGENVHPGQKIHYRLSPFIAQGIRAWDQWDRELAAEEISFDAHGQAETGRRHVWDDEAEKGASAPTAPAQAVAREVAASGAPPVLNLFDDIDQLVARQQISSPAGQAWEAPERLVAAAPRMGLVEAMQEVRRRLDRRLSPEEGEWWRLHIGDGCTAGELEQLWNESEEYSERIAL